MLCSSLGIMEMLPPCLGPASGVFVLLLAFIVCFVPLPTLQFFVIFLTNTTNSIICVFFPDFSAEKYTLSSLAEQKLGLCEEL